MIRLMDVWNGREAWTALSELKKPPKLAYRLMKYMKKFNAELEAAEAGCQAAIYEAAGVEPPALVSIGAETPEYAVFLDKFNAFLRDPSDLETVGISMDELIDGLSADAANRLTERQLALLEPFFTERAPVLQLVAPESA